MLTSQFVLFKEVQSIDTYSYRKNPANVSAPAPTVVSAAKTVSRWNCEEVGGDVWI